MRTVRSVGGRLAPSHSDCTSRIAHDLDHHLFDTLYHAIAFEYEYTLVTADDHYFRKSQHLGRIVRLSTWQETFPDESSK